MCATMYVWGVVRVRNCGGGAAKVHGCGYFGGVVLVLRVVSVGMPEISPRMHRACILSRVAWISVAICLISNLCTKPTGYVDHTRGNARQCLHNAMQGGAAFRVARVSGGQGVLVQPLREVRDKRPLAVGCPHEEGLVV